MSSFSSLGKNKKPSIWTDKFQGGELVSTLILLVVPYIFVAIIYFFPNIITNPPAGLMPYYPTIGFGVLLGLFVWWAGNVTASVWDIALSQAKSSKAALFLSLITPAIWGVSWLLLWTHFIAEALTKIQ